MLKDVFSSIIDALFPSKLKCVSCGREAVTDERGLCVDCVMGLEGFISAPPLDNIKDYTAAYIYNEVTSRPVKRLKYNGSKYLSEFLADSISLPEDWNIDAVVPVPLYYKREFKRGFNQSELIAKRLCKRTGLPFKPELLIKRKDTKQQAKLSEAGRRRNLKAAFIADASCKGMNLLIVDDVRTTGATLSECAKELKRLGANDIYAATVCFAKPRGKAGYDG